LLPADLNTSCVSIRKSRFQKSIFLTRIENKVLGAIKICSGLIIYLNPGVSNEKNDSRRNGRVCCDICGISIVPGGPCSDKREEVCGQCCPQLSTTLVLSMVYSGGGGASGTYLHDFVEIKNISATQQSLNGLSIMYGSASGQFGSASSLIFALPNITLNPGQYYLVQTAMPVRVV